MTPQELFADAMRKAANGDNKPDIRAAMDDLMCDLLEALGYGEGVKIFRDAGKWCA